MNGHKSNIKLIELVDIFQMTHSNAFPLMKMYGFWIKFHLCLSLRVEIDHGMARQPCVFSECQIGDKPVKPLPEQIMTEICKFCIDGLVQDCSISIANALEILQSCTKPFIWHHRPQWVKWVSKHLILLTNQMFVHWCTRLAALPLRRTQKTQALYSISDKTSHCSISHSLVAGKLDVKTMVSCWSLTV